MVQGGTFEDDAVLRAMEQHISREVPVPNSLHWRCIDHEGELPVRQHPEGSHGSAVMFSLIPAAIDNGLDAYRYLTWLLKTANNADLTDPQTVQNLLPWNAPAECRTK